MMITSDRNLVILFFCAILLPTSVLAYFGLQAVRDDSQRITAEQQRLAADCRRYVDRIIEQGVAALQRMPDIREVQSQGIRDMPDHLLDHVFALDQQRQWVVPALTTRQGTPMATDFSTVLEAAGRVEFAAQDVNRARSMYQALASTTVGRQRGIALNAVARCARRLSDDEQALAAYAEIIQTHADALNETGEHLATYAYLQMAELQLSKTQPCAALTTLGRWLTAVERGGVPVQEGATYHLERAAACARAAGETETAAPACDVRRSAQQLQTRILDVSSRIRFVRHNDTAIRQSAPLDSLEAASGQQLLTGRFQAAPYLITIVESPTNLLVGAQFDLAALADSLTRLVQQDLSGTNRYHLSILDDVGAAAFHREHGEDFAHVARLSNLGIGLRLGLVAADTTGLRRQLQQRRWLLLSAVVLLAGIIGFGGYALARDASRERHLAALRADFVSSVSHELKTPLASIRLFAETMLLGRVQTDEARTECLEAIVQEGDRLSRLVDNVLEFSRIEKGRRSYRMVPEDLTQVARECLDLFMYRLQSEGFQVETDIPESMPSLLLDRDAVTQAILNLLSNAVKYSPQQRAITLSVSEPPGHAIVELTDHGIGIEADERSRIFEAFYRVESDQFRTTGAGLGLTVVGHIMEAHGGSVEVAGAVGQGATFRLLFPRSAEV